MPNEPCPVCQMEPCIRPKTCQYILAMGDRIDDGKRGTLALSKVQGAILERIAKLETILPAFAPTFEPVAAELAAARARVAPAAAKIRQAEDIGDLPSMVLRAHPESNQTYPRVDCKLRAGKSCHHEACQPRGPNGQARKDTETLQTKLESTEREWRTALSERDKALESGLQQSADLRAEIAMLDERIATRDNRIAGLEANNAGLVAELRSWKQCAP
jgi:hypothetical protein